MARSALALVLALLPAACSGGGGDAPVPVAGDLRLAITGATLPTGVSTASLTVSLADRPSTLRPALLEFELAIDPPIVRIAQSTPLTAIQGTETLDGDHTANGYRVIYGFGESSDVVELPSGNLFRIALQAVTPRSPGTANISLRNLRIVDAEGDPVPTNSDPISATVTVQ